MKKTWIVIFVFVFAFGACTQNKKHQNMLIDGKVIGGEAAKVYLEDRIDQEFVVIDSAIVKGNTFNFISKLKSGHRYYFKLDQSQDRKAFFLDFGEMHIEFDIRDLQKSVLSGSVSEGLFNKYSEDTDDFEETKKQLYADYKKADAENNQLKMAEIDSLWESKEEEEKAYLLSWIKGNAESPVAAYLAERNSYKLELGELQRVYEGFGSAAVNSDYGKNTAKFIKILSSVQVGKMAPLFSMEGPDGENVKLEDFRGNYLLIDFWASWCRPCRLENPNVVKAYAQYHPKGFQILGVSHDTKKENWVKAIQDDGITWSQCSDLKGWSNRVGKLYAVRSIPHTVLLDPEGKIIAKDLRGEAL
ncbi:MAG: AhpC/TSA family protein, partial [Candidatus Marinimicrobia bacterium]|nr:AhpC/TSA family protein [Candidatus Neomarinimicrobiota bacterium]